MQAAKRRADFDKRMERKASLLALTVDNIKAQYGALVVERRDSLRSGNCEPGTDSWIATHLPGRQSATVAEILEADANNPNVRRAVIAALIRNRK